MREIPQRGMRRLRYNRTLSDVAEAIAAANSSSDVVFASAGTCDIGRCAPGPTRAHGGGVLCVCVWALRPHEGAPAQCAGSKGTLGNQWALRLSGMQLLARRLPRECAAAVRDAQGLRRCAPEQSHCLCADGRIHPPWRRIGGAGADTCRPHLRRDRSAAQARWCGSRRRRSTRRS